MRWQETSRGGTLYYPIWLSYAAAALETEHRTRLVDAPAWKWTTKDVIDDILTQKPDMVVLDTSFASWRNDLLVASKIKQICPEPFITIVGPPTAAYYEYFIRNLGVDAVVIGEYDLVLKELANAIENEQSSRICVGYATKAMVKRSKPLIEN